jgi:hypothetical protein
MQSIAWQMGTVVLRQAVPLVTVCRVSLASGQRLWLAVKLTNFRFFYSLQSTALRLTKPVLAA